jgi:hypothetical protein
MEIVMKFTLAILSLALGLNAFAQETATNVSEESGMLATLRRSNIGISFANEIRSTNLENKINGFYNKLETFIGYKLSPADAFKLSAGYYVSDTNTSVAKFNLESPSLRYKRSNILTEDQNLVTFNSEFRLYAYSNELKISKFQTGNTSWRNAFSRKFTPDFKLLGELRWDEYLRTTSTPKVARRKLMVTADPIYTFNDSLTLTPEFSFNSQVGGSGTVNKEFIMFKPMVDYVFNKAFSGEVYWEATPMVSRDQNFIAKDFAKNGVLGMILTYTIL